ncbi:hypothetical protein Dimus_023368, partial [Dionaea muscipula]
GSKNLVQPMEYQPVRRQIRAMNGFVESAEEPSSDPGQREAAALVCSGGESSSAAMATEGYRWWMAVDRGRRKNLFRLFNPSRIEAHKIYRL